MLSNDGSTVDDSTAAASGGPDERDGDDEHETGFPTRRQVLAGGGLAATGLGTYAYFGIDRAGEDPTEDRTDDEPTTFDTWREIQTALRASPDHGPGRVDPLVEGGDAEDLFEFVRDEVATKPPVIEDTGRHESKRVVWGGHRGALRSRIGTPREKADLLADLLEQAGYEAEVVLSGRDVTAEDFRTGELFSRPDLTFAPDASESDQRAWADTATTGAGASEDVPVFDDDGEDSAALANDLLSAFDVAEDADLAEFGFVTTSGRPIVRFREGGTADAAWRYADLFADGETFGTEAPEDPVSEIDERDAPAVTVSLEAIPADDPRAADSRIELVSGHWEGPDLAGRQVFASFLPDVSPLDDPAVRYRDVTRFVPSLAVQDPHADSDDLEALSVVGDATTVTGDQTDLGGTGEDDADGDGDVDDDRGDGEQTSNAGDAGAAVDDAAELSVSVEGVSYPEITIQGTVRDDDGDLVEGLPGSAFGVTEDGEPVSAIVDSRTTAPAVSLLVDTSGSMPSRGFDEAEREEIRSGLEADIREANDDAVVTLEETDSELYTWSAEMARSNADVVVYLTDGEETDSLTDAYEEAIRAGPRIVVVSVVEEPMEASETIADLSDGTVVTWEDREETQSAIAEYVTDLLPEILPYKLRYDSPHGYAGGEHVEVAVAVPDADLEETLTYEVPEERLGPDVPFAGLVLSVAVDDRDCERVLAGYDPILDADRDPDETDVEETHAALFGTYVLSLESDGVPPGVQLEELVAGNLTIEPLAERVEDDDVEGVREHLDSGGVGILSEWAQLLLAPYPGRSTENSLTYCTGLQTVLYAERPVFGADYVHQSIDLLPTHRVRTVRADEDHERAFEQTIERTARPMVVESEAFDSSTASLLESSTTVLAADESEEWNEADEETFGRVRDRGGYDTTYGISHLHLVAEGEPPTAFWSIDAETGQLVGVLPDGSGGGSTEADIEESLEEISRIVAGLNLMITAVGKTVPIGGAVGIVAAYYGDLLARLYAIAATSIATMSAEDVDEQVAEAIASFVCNLAVGIAVGKAGDAGELADVMNNVSVASGDDALYGC